MSIVFRGQTLTDRGGCQEMAVVLSRAKDTLEQVRDALPDLVDGERLSEAVGLIGDVERDLDDLDLELEHHG
jgi:hypothetical protein